MTNACAVHAGAAAQFTCTRCGSFACEQCTSSIDALCAACDRLRGAVLGSDVSAGGLIGDSFSLVARFGGAVAAFAIVDAVAEAAVALVGGSLPQHWAFIVLMALVGAAVTTIVQGAWISMLASAAQGAPLGLGPAFGRGAAVALPLFACNLLLGIGVGLGLLLLIVPGIVLALGWCMAGSALVVNRMGPIEALGESWGVTNGHRVTLLLAFLATGGVALVVSFVVGAAGNLLTAQVPVAARFIAVATSVMSTVATAPVLTVPVLGYLRVKRSFTAD